MRMMTFKATGNLGDNLQAVALARLLGPASGWFRDQPEFTIDIDGPGVASGFLLGAQSYNPEKTFFSGIWYPAHNEAHVPWLRKTPWPIGARDPVTLSRVAKAGMRVQLVGCPSLTLPKYIGPRFGEIYVDVKDGPGNDWSHSISPYLKLSEEWALAKCALDRYARAALVHTSRLHVALPCVALGTPVRYLGPRDDRTSILDTVGIPQGRECSPDSSYWRELFVDFIERNLGVKCQDGGYVTTPIPTVHHRA